MLAEGIKKYMLNPCWGLLPFLLYLVLYRAMEDVQTALILSLLFAVVAQVALKLYTRTTRDSIMFLISFISLTLTLLVWTVLRDMDYSNNNVYLIMPEIFAVCIFFIAKAYKSLVNQNFIEDGSAMQKALFNDFFEIASFTQFFFTMHIFIILIYKFMKDNHAISASNDVFVFIWIPVVGIIVLNLYENIKIKTIVNKLRQEDWIPIVNEKGDVTGRIAKSVSLQMKNKFLHPVVRVALVCNGKIYLRNRGGADVLDPDSFDHPFENYMLFEHEIDHTVKNSIFQTLGTELPFRFLLKYTFENKNTKRLIFLFASVLKDESELEELNLLHGKLWTPKQIDNDFGDDSKFSECFQLEYEYLKNTVIAASNVEKEISSTPVF